MKDFIKTATIKELSNGLKNKKFSSLELTTAYLERAKNLNPKTNAFITLTQEQAISDAKKADELISKGKAKPLTGIPLGIKDNICTKNIKTTCASKMLEDFTPVYDSTAISNLKKQGAVIIGKTNMDEFAMGGSSSTSYFGAVHNPYDFTRVSGGSSGGSATAVSASMCAASLGSDTGGSVRQPASFCGITGLKPTYGTVSRYGLIAFASSFDQIGTMAKSAEDCAVLLKAIAGADKFDSTCNGFGSKNYLSQLGKGVKNLKIALPKEFFGDEIDATVKAEVFKAAETYKKMGAEIIEVSLPDLKYAVAAYYLISSAEAASNLSRYDGIKYGHRSEKGKSYEEVIKNSRREGFGKEVKRRIMLGNYALSSGYYDAYYNKAVLIRQKLRCELDKIFKSCDFILTPTAPTTAYKIGSFEKNPVKMYSADICTVLANIAGLPAISTTCGYDKKGLPIGISLMGKAFSEGLLIGAADAFEKQFERKEPEL
jgi:aspartyl-tRNA(Asn)/glutamyl-tRNA(Gln) amidotransferase subunit A